MVRDLISYEGLKPGPLNCRQIYQLADQRGIINLWLIGCNGIIRKQVLCSRLKYGVLGQNEVTSALFIVDFINHIRQFQINCPPEVGWILFQELYSGPLGYLETDHWVTDEHY